MKIAKAPLRQIMKEAGAEVVSEKGLEEYRREVERYAFLLGEMSVLCAKHAKRKKIMAEDIRLAVR